MRTISYREEDLRTVVIGIGYVGENEHTQVRIDCSTTLLEYPEAVAGMIIVPPAGAAYPKTVTRDGNVVVWDVTDSDLASEGSGEMQLSFVVGNVVVKSCVAKICVQRSITGNGPAPDPMDDWLTEANETLAEVDDALVAIPEAIDTALEQAKESGEFDGPPGAPGQDGAPGADGFSPTATVTKSGKVVTITITDKNGTTEETVSDGESGAQIDDTAGAGDTDVTWSADKLAEEFTDVLTAIQGITPNAQQSDIGKALILKTIDQTGKPTAFEYGEAGGGSVDPSVVEQKVDEWLEENISNPDSPPLDRSLSSGSAAAPADLTGNIINQATQKTRNMFDDIALKNAGLSKDSNGYWYGKASEWNSAFSSLLPVAEAFETGKVYTISCKYYFSDVSTYTGNVNTLKRAYTDETTSNGINFNASNTTETSVSAKTSSSKNLDHLFFTALDSRGNNYILHIKELQIEEGEEKTKYITHITGKDDIIHEQLEKYADDSSHTAAEYLGINSLKIEWEIGYYNITSGAKQESTISARSKKLYHLKKGTRVYPDTGYMIRIYRYTQDSLTSFAECYGHDYDTTYNYITGCFDVPSDGYYNFVIKDYSGTTVTDAETWGSHFHIMPDVALNNLADSLSASIMPYNLTGLKAYIDEVAAMNGDVVLHLVTDIHGGYPDTYAVINYLANAGIGNYMFEMGDVIKNTYPTRAESVAYLRDSFHTMAYTKTNTPIIILQGNHDTNPLAGTDTSKNVTQEIFYDLSMARTKETKQLLKKAYGFVDIDNVCVRVIYLNTSDIYDASTGNALVTGQYTMIQQGQIDWLIGTALNFADKETPTDWSVIIVSHDSLSQIASSAFSNIMTAFKTGSTANGSQTVTVGTYSNVINYTCDFTSQGALNVICEVNGHHHKDMIRELGTTGIKQVYVACEGPASASYDNNGETVYYDRVRGTTDEHLIDTLVLDKTAGKVYFKRFGIGTDREITY